jgi:uncharacterized SAM-binding protein YcdF (DUF218 family)
MLLIASLPIVASLLLYSLESQYEEPTAANLALANAVVVLEGDYVKGKDPSRDRTGATAPRVLCGVAGFKQSGAGWLIMSGREERPVELMRDLAIDLGVPPQQILIDPLSRQTFQHPLEIRKLAQIGNADTIVVVSDTFHLPRAMPGFRRHFPRVAPIPCDLHGAPEVGPRQFLPHATALTRTTTMLQEYLGIAWYSIRDPGG